MAHSVCCKWCTLAISERILKIGYCMTKLRPIILRVLLYSDSPGRSFQGRFLQVRWPNQQRQNTEGNQFTLQAIYTKTQIFVSHGSVETLFRWNGKCVHCWVANVFRILSTRLYQNWPSFIKDTIKTFWFTSYWLTVYITRLHRIHATTAPPKLRPYGAIQICLLLLLLLLLLMVLAFANLSCAHAVQKRTNRCWCGDCWKWWSIALDEYNTVNATSNPFSHNDGLTQTTSGTCYVIVIAKSTRKINYILKTLRYSQSRRYNDSLTSDQVVCDPVPDQPGSVTAVLVGYNDSVAASLPRNVQLPAVAYAADDARMHTHHCTLSQKTLSQTCNNTSTVSLLQIAFLVRLPCNNLAVRSFIHTV